MGYYMQNVEVRIARYGEILPHSFRTDVYVDASRNHTERYAYGATYEDASGTMYMHERERLAWYQLIIYPEDTEHKPGFKKTSAQMKLTYGRKVARAERRLQAAQAALNKLL